MCLLSVAVSSVMCFTVFLSMRNGSPFLLQTQYRVAGLSTTSFMTMIPDRAGECTRTFARVGATNARIKLACRSSFNALACASCHVVVGRRYVSVSNDFAALRSVRVRRRLSALHPLSKWRSGCLRFDKAKTRM